MRPLIICWLSVTSWQKGAVVLKGNTLGFGNGLHEACYATDDAEVKKATDKLAEFLCRIQVKSNNLPELDGGWMRAFDYQRFEQWGSNADLGWGAWAIETGWTQGWITAILALRDMDVSIWDLTKNSEIARHHAKLKKEMIPMK